jgi:hypothetical protein
MDFKNEPAPILRSPERVFAGEAGECESKGGLRKNAAGSF